ncbi:MAG: hypothetical protein ACYC3Q_00580 [Gemmatimonadaceae bacterium]
MTRSLSDAFDRAADAASPALCTLLAQHVDAARRGGLTAAEMLVDFKQHMARTVARHPMTDARQLLWADLVSRSIRIYYHEVNVDRGGAMSPDRVAAGPALPPPR